MLEVPGEWGQLVGHLSRGLPERGQKLCEPSLLSPWLRVSVRDWGFYWGLAGTRKARGGDSCGGGSKCAGDKRCVKSMLIYQFSLAAFVEFLLCAGHCCKVADTRFHGASGLVGRDRQASKWIIELGR